MTAEQAASTILAAEYISSPLSFDSKDPLRLGEGTLVSIETVEYVDSPSRNHTLIPG